jgi:hypothetical protein
MVLLSTTSILSAMKRGAGAPNQLGEFLAEYRSRLKGRPPRTQRKVNDREHSHGPLGEWPGIPEINSAKESDLSLRTRARALIQEGEERTQRLRWIAAVASAALDSVHHGTQQETTELESRRNRT